MTISKTLGAFVLIMCAGCSSAIHEPFRISNDDRPTSLSIDARQRVILSMDQGAEKGHKRIVCAEPSPDAIVSMAASGSLQVPIADQKLLEAKGKSTETVSVLGTRTSTIQLLRDNLYRACEAYMNGAINEQRYKDMLYMFDDFVIVLFAIDELSKVQASQSPQLISDQPPAGTTPLNAHPDVPQVIKEIVLKYLENQMELYGMRGKDPLEFKDTDTKGERQKPMTNAPGAEK